MGYTVWIQREDDAEDACPPDLSTFYRASETLDTLATQLGVTRPSEFFDESEVAAEADIDLPPRYSQAQEVSASIDAISKALGEGKVTLGDNDKDELAEELAHMQSVLKAAVAASVRVRLTVVP